MKILQRIGILPSVIISLLAPENQSREYLQAVPLSEMIGGIQEVILNL